MKKTIFGWVGILAAAWLLGLFLAALYLWPWTGGRSWLWFVVAGPPLALGMELLGAAYHALWIEGPLGKALEERTEDRRFSLLRVLFALVGWALLMMVLVAISLLFRRF